MPLCNTLSLCKALWSLRGSHPSVCIFLCVLTYVFVWLPVVNLAALLFIFFYLVDFIKRVWVPDSRAI